MRSKLNLSKKQLNLLYLVIHVTAWTLMFLLPFAFFNATFNRDSILFNSIILIKALIIFYLNFLFLVPRFLLQKKVGAFFLSIIIVLIVNLTLTSFESKYIPPPSTIERVSSLPPLKEPFNSHDHARSMFDDDRERPEPENMNVRYTKPFFDFRFIGQFSFVLMLIGVSASLKLTEEWFKSEKYKEEVKNEQLTTELAFLKSQINPHFLFNSLNSIYSLSYKKSDRAPEAIIQLSKIMRYIIDDAARTAVPLEKELDHLFDYIELQKLRLTDKTKLTYSVNNQSSGELIEPMLLVPFVENAFKHGIDSINNSFIKVKIEIIKNKLVFESTNTIARQKMETTEAESGIGLKNVIRRLDLLYPNAYNLKITEEQEVYGLILNLTLKNYELLNS